MRELQQEIDVAEFVKPERKKRVKKEKKSFHLKRKLLLVGLVLVGLAIGGERYANWRAVNQLRTPIIIQLPWEKKEVQATNVIVEAKSMSKEQIVASSRHPEEIDMIWLLESGRGENSNDQALHNYCKSKGETNEFGFGGMKEMICFKTFQESVDRVSQWLDIREAQLYCEYGTGVRTTDCSYVDRVAIAKLK